MLEVPMSALSVSRPRFGGFWVLWRTLEFNSSVLCESPSHALESATKTACTRLSSSPVTAASSSSFLKRVLILRRVDEKGFPRAANGEPQPSFPHSTCLERSYPEAVSGNPIERGDEPPFDQTQRGCEALWPMQR